MLRFDILRYESGDGRSINNVVLGMPWVPGSIDTCTSLRSTWDDNMPKNASFGVSGLSLGVTGQIAQFQRHCTLEGEGKLLLLL